MFVYHLAHGIFQEYNELIKRFDLALQFYAAYQKNRYWHTLFAQGVQERILKRLPLAHDKPLLIIYFPLSFTIGSSFNGSLLAQDYGSLLSGEASLVIYFPLGFADEPDSPKYQFCFTDAKPCFADSRQSFEEIGKSHSPDSISQDGAVQYKPLRHGYACISFQQAVPG